jgi:hypothetical protein
VLFCGEVICGLPACSLLGLWPVIKVNFGYATSFSAWMAVFLLKGFTATR